MEQIANGKEESKSNIFMTVEADQALSSEKLWWENWYSL